MKKLIIILILFINYITYSQYNQLYTTERYNDYVNTAENHTIINLFDIDFNGDKIPLQLSYTHNGVKVDEQQGNIGIHWKIENLGYINTTVNHITDYQSNGWFNTIDPSFEPYANVNQCTTQFGCQGFGALNQDDLSPDFFSVGLSNGNHFDFLFKKVIQNGTINDPLPVFLSNPLGYKIETNFNTFISNQSELNPIDTRVVFKIIDNKGNNYDFIKGPLLGLQNLSNYNNYYLKSLTSPNNQDFINVNYISKEVATNKGYKTGYNQFNLYGVSGGALSCENNVSNNIDYNSNIVRCRTGVATDMVSESRLDIKSILTNKIIIDFVYAANNELVDEINITDFNGKYITGYKFIYQNFQGTTTSTLYQIKKYNSTKLDTQVIYEFEYYDGLDFFSLFNQSSNDEKQQYTDYMGYFNNEQKTNLLPFDGRLSYGDGGPNLPSSNNCNIIPAGNFIPNVNWAKNHSLYKIKNRFSGVIEFDYQLNMGVHSSFGNVYGGGLLISSKKIIPLEGKTMYTTFIYENPSGFILQMDNIGVHYLKELQGFKFYSSIPVLSDTYDLFQDDPGLWSTQKTGNFFHTITETNFDFATMEIQSKIVREFVPNYEGIHRGAILKSETQINSNNQLVKKTDYHFSYQTLETINRSEYNFESRDCVWQIPLPITIIKYGLLNKTNSPIYINRVNLLGITNETYSNGGTIIENKTFSYINPNSKILRSKAITSTLGDIIEERYFYPNDPQLVNEPFVADMTSKNMIGIPLKREVYKGTEKIFEEKTQYSMDSSTSNLLLPKHIFVKKGADILSNFLIKKITFDKYDSYGNLLQFTPEKGMTTSTIWGYNSTVPIAVLENVVYSSISPFTISDLQTKSNQDNDNCQLSTCKEEMLRSVLNTLRTTFPLAMITTYTYDPVVGITSVTDLKADKNIIEYDDYNRLKTTRDRDNNILSETEYHYIPQN